MLKKQNRLKSRLSFTFTYANNHVVKSDKVLLWASKEKTNPATSTRVGFVVSKKVHKRAVVRNRIKRLIREVIRLNFKNSHDSVFKKYQSLIFQARNSSVDCTFEDINNSILQIISKLANN